MSFIVLETRGIFWQGCWSKKRRETCCKLILHLRSWKHKGFMRHLVQSIRRKIVENARCRCSRLLRFCCVYRKRSDERARNQIHQKMEWLSRAILGIRKEIWEKDSVCTPHVSRPKDKRDWAQKRWMDMTREDGHNFTPEICPHRVLFMGMMNEVPISSKGLQVGKSLFLHDTERNAAHFGRFKPRYNGPGSEKTWNFAKYPDDPEGKWDELETCTWAPGIDVKMMMRHVRSANDFCLVFGICDYLGKINEIALESRPNTASVLSLDLIMQLTISQFRKREKLQ